MRFPGTGNYRNDAGLRDCQRARISREATARADRNGRVENVPVRILERYEDAQEVETRISRSRLLYTPPADRPRPDLFRKEVLSLKPMLVAYPDPQREKQLDAAIKSVDLAALDRGDIGVVEGDLAR